MLILQKNLHFLQNRFVAEQKRVALHVAEVNLDVDMVLYPVIQIYLLKLSCSACNLTYSTQWPRVVEHTAGCAQTRSIM